MRRRLAVSVPLSPTARKMARPAKPSPASLQERWRGARQRSATDRLCASRSPTRNAARGSCRAAYGDAIEPQRRLTDADGDTLAVLAARTDAGVERKIIADHADAAQIGRPVADQHGALDGRTEPAVLDLVRLGALENIFPRGDVDLAAAEAHRVEPVLHRGNDLFRIMDAG